MPYIKKEARDEIFLNGRFPETAGELNFVLTSFCINYLDQDELSYQKINDVIGALEGAKLEFYRRLATPYEDKKIKENGDVYYV